MKFTLEIELGNDAMERSDDVRRALKELHRHLGDQWIRGQLLNREDGGKIMDVNGNTVGKWEVTANDHAYNGYPDGSACFTCGAKRTAEVHQ